MISQNSNAYELVRDYFQNISESLQSEKSASKIFSNTSDAGLIREDILKEFLSLHLPKRCDIIKGGFIFDAEENMSKQLDLIVTNDLTLQFKQFSNAQSSGKSFNCIEGASCAISVKTQLDKKGLIDSIENLASIPQMPQLEVNPMLKTTGLLNDLPICVIFAFSGLEWETIITHLVNYIAKQKIPRNREPDFIIVNNNYTIIKTGKEGGTMTDGEKIAPFSFVSIRELEYNGAYALWTLITEIQKAANFSSHIIMNFNKYSDKIGKLCRHKS